VTEDQTVKNSKERNRIVAAGGRVDGDRVYCSNSNEPGLIPTRAYGDFNGIPAGIICDPDIQTYNIGKETVWMCIMSDGVWENVQAVAVSSAIMGGNSTQESSRRIVEEAKRIIHAGKRYRDDMTAVVVQFHNYGMPQQPRSRKISGNEEFEDVPDISDEEMIVQSVLVCREAMEQGVHVDDVLDMLVGLSDELKHKVKLELERNTEFGVEQAVEPATQWEEPPSSFTTGKSSNKTTPVPSRKNSMTQSNSNNKAKRGDSIKSGKQMFRRRTLTDK